MKGYDLIIIGSNVDFILGLKNQLVDTFEMTDLGMWHFLYGIQVLWMDDGISISQPKYVLHYKGSKWKVVNRVLHLTNRQ